jgi:hypothetical protein
MNKICWLSWLSNPATGRRIAGGIGAAILLMGTGIAVAQAPAPDAQPVAPNGYSLHNTVDLGGRMANIDGSGAMYDTMVNEHSGPRVLGEKFELRALPGTQHMLVDSLTAFSNGWGGDPDDFARLNAYKGRLYEFSGLFRRDRQYFDYDLLGNPNILGGQTIPVTGGSALPWSQVNQSPFLFNTVRRMTDVNLTLLPLSRVSFRVGYSQDIFQGPSLTPSGFWEISAPVSLIYDTLLQENQRNSTDAFFGAFDWKPMKDTKLSYEEQIDHFKSDSYFTLDPALYNVQEPDGTKAALLASYDSLTAPAVGCNANSVGTSPSLSAPNTPGGLPVVNPACNVVTGYQRYQPTRYLFPTEIFRFQSSSIRKLSMNGDFRYTQANMNLPNYYENLQGLLGAKAGVGALRELIYTTSASAKREVTAVDYGVEWAATEKFSLGDEFTFSNAQQPGSATITSAVGLTTPATAGNETINYTGQLTSVTAGLNPGPPSAIGAPAYGFFGQRFINNDVTATWNGWSRATLSLTYRHRNHVIAEGIPHNTALAFTTSNPTNNGTVTINEDGGILNVALRPTSRWDVSGSAELLYDDNAFTPVAPRQSQHYRVHTLYRVNSWATLSGAYNDLERKNNTNNLGVASIDGPLGHLDHSRLASLGAQVFPNEHYGLDFNYSYSDVYTSTNICYDGAGSAATPAAAPASGAGCIDGTKVRGTTYYDFGPVKDFEDAPTQSGSAAVTLSPSKRVHSEFGYRISSVNGSRFYNDPRDVAGSLVSTWQSPFVKVAYTVRPNWIWKAEYNFYGYGEGGPSGAPYCSTSNPTTTAPVPVVACASLPNTGMSISPAGETAPRNFHANNVTLGFHYEF